MNKITRGCFITIDLIITVKQHLFDRVRGALENANVQHSLPVHVFYPATSLAETQLHPYENSTGHYPDNSQ